MFKIICIILLIPAFLAAQPNGTEEHALEIMNNWNRLESKFKEKANERLLYFLNEDPILKENFISGDSSNYKKLKLRIMPILKFKKEAENYTFDQDIFDLIEFDTIDYHSSAGFYLDNKLCFFITRGHNDCDTGPIYFGGGEPDWCSGDFFFEQYYYPEDKKKDCLIPGYEIIRDTSFVFYVDGFYNGFVINNWTRRITIYKEDFNNDLIMRLDKPTEFIRKMYDEEWIQHCARKCPVGGKKPWWMFWKWF